MRIAIFVGKDNFKFYDITDDLRKQFEEKFAAKKWRIVDIDEASTKAEAVALANKIIKTRIRKIKFDAGRKKTITENKRRKTEGGAYRILGSLKTYYRTINKMDATKMIGTKVL